MYILKVFFRDIILSFLCIPIRFVSFLIPKDRKLVIFGSWMGKNFSDNPKHFLPFLDKLDKYRIIVLTDNKDDRDQLKEKSIESYSRYSFKGLFYSMRASTIFITHSVNQDINGYTVSKNSNVIQFWHGSPVKKLTSLGYINSIGFFAKLKSIHTFLYRISNLLSPKFKHIIALNDYSKEKLSSFFQVSPDKVKITGYPRNDIFFKYQPKNDGVNRVLYLPTYRNKIEDPSPLLKKLNYLDKEFENSNTDFIIKLHPAVAGKMVLEEYKNIFDFKKYFVDADAQEGMAMSDILISDYSGIIFDFFISNRPVIFYPYDYEDYVKKPGFYFNYFEEFPGPFAKNPEEIVGLINSADEWFSNDDYSERYSRFRDKYHSHLDGNSSNRLYNLLKSEGVVV